jgi:hypothetical protein
MTGTGALPAAIGVRIGEGPQSRPKPTFGNGARAEIKNSATLDSIGIQFFPR